MNHTDSEKVPAADESSMVERVERISSTRRAFGHPGIYFVILGVVIGAFGLIAYNEPHFMESFAVFDLDSRGTGVLFIPTGLVTILSGIALISTLNPKNSL